MAISTAQDIIILRMPSVTPSSALTDKIALAETVLCKSEFGTKGEYAIALQVLHWLALENRSGGENKSGVGGSIASLKEGDLAVGYRHSSSSSSGSGDLAQTSYGQELQRLIETCIISPMNRCI